MSEQYAAPHGARILTCKFGAGGRVEMEIEWQGGWDEHLKTWRGWNAQLAQKGGDALFETLSELLESEPIGE